MSSWLHRYFNPHCPDCREDRKCETCEVLLMENEKLRFQNEQLLNRILNPKDEPVKNEVKEISPISGTGHIPWRVRQQLLETEDRKKAQLMRDAAKPNTEKLEREVLG